MKTRTAADRLAELLYEHHDHMVHVVHARFPGLCVGRIDDAVSGAYEALAREPVRFQYALETGGVAWMVGLALTIGCRAARGQVRRRAFSREIGEAVGDPQGDPHRDTCPDLALAVDLSRRLRPLLASAARQFGSKRSPQLLIALLEKVETGDDDTALAARHGLRREHVNRAWSQVRRELCETGLRRAA